jgi:probable HAF family extracellular repeat protein
MATGTRMVAMMTAAAMALAVGSAAAQSYTVTDLGTLGGRQSSAVALNNAGQVAGESWMAGNTTQHGFVWSNGVMFDVTFTPSEVTAMNAAGQVTGIAYWPDGGGRAFISTNGVMTDLGSLSGGASTGFAINASGQVAGTSSVATFPWTAHAFRYSDGVLSDLGTLGGEWSYAAAINDDGHVTGWAHTAEHLAHAFVYRDDRPRHARRRVQPGLGDQQRRAGHG